MNVAAAARIVAYLLAALAASGPVLAGTDPPRIAAAGWREPLQRADAALASGDPRAAHQAWEQAYRAAIHGRATEGLLEVGHAYLRIGEVARDRSTAVAWARRIFLAALFQARERRDGPAVAAAAVAFAALGDRDLADRAFEIAIAVATRHGDAAARERIAAVRARAGDARPEHIGPHSP